MRYTVKVKAEGETERKTYLWGGAEVTNPFISQSPLFLTFRVDEMGEEITVKTEKNQQDIGKLQPGETFTIQLNNLTGISAQCNGGVDTKVECFIEALPRSD